MFVLPLGAQWVQVSGSYGGYSQCVVVIGTELFAGTGGGVFLSTDNGTSWKAANNGLKGSVTSFAASGANLFAGTSGNGVFLSSNKGANWSAVNDGLTNLSVSCLAVSGSLIFAGTSGSGVFLSTNNGANWSAVSNGLVDLSVFCLATHDSSVFAGLYQGVFRSTNNGTNWTAINNGFRPPGARVPDYDVHSIVVNDSSIFAAAHYGVYRSTDNGSSWTATSALPIIIGGSIHFFLAANNSNIIASNGVDVFSSTDNGTSWTTVSNGLPKSAYNVPTIHSLAVKDSSLFAGTDAGVFCSTDDGRSWINMSNGLNASVVRPLAVNGSTIFAVGANGYGSHRSSNNGVTWASIGSLADYHVHSFATNGSCVVAGTDGPVLVSGASPILRSTDSGASWTIIGNAIVGHCLALNDAYVFVGSQYGPVGGFRCPIDSSTWTELSVGPGIRALATNGSNIFAGTMLQGVFHSSDNGTHWTAATSGLDTYTVVAALAVNGSNVFAATSTNPEGGNIQGVGIFRSRDAGVSWTSVNTGLTVLNITALAIHDSVLYAGTDSGGVFLSTNNGTSWSPFNADLPNPYVSSLALNDTYIYAGILGGLWRRPLSEELVSVPPSGKNVPLQFGLEQNFPNPFNPTTVIRYELALTSYVVLKIYDVLGKEVETLINEWLSAGSHSGTFNAKELPSGIYFYRLQAGDFVETKKMILLK